MTKKDKTMHIFFKSKWSWTSFCDQLFCSSLARRRSACYLRAACSGWTSSPTRHLPYSYPRVVCFLCWSINWLKAFHVGPFDVVLQWYMLLYPCVYGLEGYGHLNNCCLHVSFWLWFKIENRLKIHSVTVFNKGYWMTTCFRKSFSFGLPCVVFVVSVITFFPFWF